MMFGGGVWPVVQRELRATARWPLGPWLRMGAALFGVIIFCAITSDTPERVAGAELFGLIHLLLLGLICVFLPAMTADCIARERREGTLGLLFMTPLTSSGIVVGKVMAQTLRVLTLWLALVPLLTIPFLYGGVTVADVANFLTIELCIGMLCLAAGILASSLTENRAVAFILAFLLTAACAREFHPFRDWKLLQPSSVARTKRYVNSSFYVTTTVFRPAMPLRPGPLQVALVEVVATAIVLFAAVRFAGWRVERSWQDKIPSVRQQNWVRRYCTPLFARWFAGRMRIAKERNPVAWLQQYSWKSRVSKWGLCLLFVLLECAVIDGNQPYILGAVSSALLAVLAAAYTYAGVNGFLQEKRSGALELMLVSPLSVNQIIFGRVWGLWKQFLPTVLVVVGADFAIHSMIPHYSWGWYGMDQSSGIWSLLKNGEITAIYLTLPVIATSYALSSNNLFVASALTVVTGFGPTLALLVIALGAGLEDNRSIMVVAELFFLIGLVISHTWIAFGSYQRLGRNLAGRRYSF